VETHTKDHLAMLDETRISPPLIIHQELSRKTIPCSRTVRATFTAYGSPEILRNYFLIMLPQDPLIGSDRTTRCAPYYDIYDKVELACGSATPFVA